jgi:hypothetical protein
VLFALPWSYRLSLSLPSVLLCIFLGCRHDGA